MPKFRKKPVVIEATQWFKAIQNPSVREPSEELMFQIDPDSKTCDRCLRPWDAHGECGTLEGLHIVCPGDWIITGVAGEIYPCKPDIFEKTYDPA